MNIFGSLTQFDFVKIIRRRNETSIPEEGIASVGLLGGDSGAFTPTISNIQNGATIDVIQGMYCRVGNVVTMTFGVNVEIAVGESSTIFDFSLPIASNFPEPYQLYCSCNFDAKLITLYAKSSSSIGRLTIETTSEGVSITDLQIMVQYLIIS